MIQSIRMMTIAITMMAVMMAFGRRIPDAAADGPARMSSDGKKQPKSDRAGAKKFPWDRGLFHYELLQGVRMC